MYSSSAPMAGRLPLRHLSLVRPIRRLASAASVGIALAVLGTPALLLAHAKLVRAVPGVGSVVVAPPSVISLWFSEKPEARFTKIELLDSTGTAVALGEVAGVPDERMAMSAAVVGTMANGRYTVSWRTAGADGHAITGKFTFTLDAPAAAAAPAPPDTQQTPPSAERIPNTVVSVSPSVFSTTARWVELVALLTLVGAVVFKLLVLPLAGFGPEQVADATDRARRLADAMLVLFVATTLWRLSSQADLLAGGPTGRVAAMISVARDTQWGHNWLTGATGTVVVILGLIVARGSAIGWPIAGLGLIAASLGEGLTGHAGALESNARVAMAADVVHVFGAGGWLGGLTVVFLCGLPAIARLDDAEKKRLGRELVRSYHRIALLCVSLVVLTGIVAACTRLSSLSELWTTPYGTVLFRKLVFVFVLFGFGWYHWRTVVKPEWGDDTRFRFTRSVVGELLVGGVVLAATAVLVATALATH